jgi:hypothetical protein
LDVYGKLKATKIEVEILKVVRLKQKELPVIVILPTIADCERMEQLF